MFGAILGLDDIQLIAIIATVMAFAVVLELVRRRRLVERYALLWMLMAVGLLILAVWRGLLNILADAAGISFPPNALFLAAFGVVFVLLLHFSVATSRLSEEAKMLAQEVARLDAEVRELQAARNGTGPASASAKKPGDDRPVGAQRARDRS